jgi:hypothetical protein
MKIFVQNELGKLIIKLLRHRRENDVNVECKEVCCEI